MRRRFFLIVLGFLAITILVVSVLQQVYVRAEQDHLIDQRLETIASSLIASGLSVDLVDNLETTDDLIQDLLGNERVDLLINIYSDDGEILAQNATATKIQLPFSATQQWQDYQVDKRKVRVLNLAKDNLIIQVGSFRDPDPSRATPFNEYFVSFLLLVSILLLTVAYLSSQTLFRPLSKLSRELEAMSGQLDHKLGQPLSGFVVAPELLRLATSKSKSKDEFEQLCLQLKLFLNRLETYTRSFNAQTAILTHELKTPLTILKNYLTELKRTPNVESARSLGTEAIEEVDNLTALINDYLQWSVLSSNPSQPAELYALNLREHVERIVSALNSQHGQRVELEISGDPKIFANPQHIEQLIANMLSNALNYSPTDKKVKCLLSIHSLVVSDQGSGIPDDVLKHLGEPFNRGTLRSARSSGLGLAWIQALVEKYKWRLSIDSNPGGTKLSVFFE